MYSLSVIPFYLKSYSLLSLLNWHFIFINYINVFLRSFSTFVRSLLTLFITFAHLLLFLVVVWIMFWLYIRWNDKFALVASFYYKKALSHFILRAWDTTILWAFDVTIQWYLIPLWALCLCRTYELKEYWGNVRTECSPLGLKLLLLRAMYDWMAALISHSFSNMLEVVDLCTLRWLFNNPHTLPVYMGCDVFFSFE